MMWGLDLETPVHHRGRVPLPVCGAFSTDRGDWVLHGQLDQEFWPAVALSLQGPHSVSTMAFDLEVLAEHGPGWTRPLVYGALIGDRIHNPLTGEKLLDIEEGTYSKSRGYGLKDVADRRIGRELDKSEDTWRLRYGELISVPIDQWPVDAVAYASTDGLTHRQAAERQVLDGVSPDAARQARGEWVLQRAATHGMLVDPNEVEEVDAGMQEELTKIRAAVNEVSQEVADEDWIYHKKDKGVWRWSKRVKRIQQWLEATLEPHIIRWTDGGKTGVPKVSLDREACQQYSAFEPAFEGYSEYVRVSGLVDRVIKAFRSPNPETGRIHTHYDELVVTGRASSGDPAMMNLPRKGGFRECLVAPEGHTLVIVDYKGQELCTLAQHCIDQFGWSRLADTINSGKDAHYQTAATLLGWSYEDIIAAGKAGDKQAKDTRQLAKAVNFGLPGLMGEVRFTSYAKTEYGVRIPRGQFQYLKQAWMETYPEMELHFEFITSQSQPVSVWNARAQRRTGGRKHPNACNIVFQGPASDMSKDAGFRICYEQEMVPSSGLFGSKLVLFAHDEWVAEAEDSQVESIEAGMSRLMLDAGKTWAPDIAMQVEPTRTKRYKK